ncbi:hypothetical protein MTO96_030681 [Rhipicephalus appendiculatus]
MLRPLAGPHERGHSYVPLCFDCIDEHLDFVVERTVLKQLNERPELLPVAVRHVDHHPHHDVLVEGVNDGRIFRVSVERAPDV